MATDQKLTASTVEDYNNCMKQLNNMLLENCGREKLHQDRTTAERVAFSIASIIDTHVLDSMDALRALVAEKEAKDA